METTSTWHICCNRKTRLKWSTRKSILRQCLVPIFLEGWEPGVAPKPDFCFSLCCSSIPSQTHQLPAPPSSAWLVHVQHGHLIMTALGWLGMQISAKKNKTKKLLWSPMHKKTDRKHFHQLHWKGWKGKVESICSWVGDVFRLFSLWN